jgi:hypothetical protein
MIRKILNMNSNYEPEYKSDCLRIQQILIEHGFESDLYDCEILWRDYSDGLAAGWLSLPESDERLWRTLEHRVKEQSILNYLQ